MGSTAVVMVAVGLLGGFTVGVDFLVANVLRLII
jgi:preprotein translocase subunit SecE